jgi:CheY-like chemotaxis protein
MLLKAAPRGPGGRDEVVRGLSSCRPQVRKGAPQIDMLMPDLDGFETMRTIRGIDE